METGLELGTGVNIWFRFHFEDGKVTGIGDDEMGEFILRGSYNLDEKSSIFDKIYIGRSYSLDEHELEGRFEVITEGFHKCHLALEGTVKIRDQDVGTFRLVSRQVYAEH